MATKRVGIAWGNLGRESDPAAWIVVRLRDGAMLGAASSQGGALRLAHAVWDELDASWRLNGPTIVLVVDDQIVGFVARRTRAEDASAQVHALKPKVARRVKSRDRAVEPVSLGDGLRVRLPAAMAADLESLRGFGIVRPTVQSVAIAAMTLGIEELKARKDGSNER